MIRARAFTAIELIISIGIVGILAALLVPALASTRQSAAQLACGVQLRSLNTALQLYADANDQLPISSVIIGARPNEMRTGDANPLARLELPEALAEFLDANPPALDKDGEITSGAPWTCPSERRYTETDHRGHHFLPDGFSYGYGAAALMAPGRSLHDLYKLPDSPTAGRAALRHYQNDTNQVIFFDEEPFHAGDPGAARGSAGRNFVDFNGSVRIN